MAERNQENGTVAMANVGQTNDTRTDVQVFHSGHFRSLKQGWKTAKLGSKRVVDPGRDQLNPSVITKN